MKKALSVGLVAALTYPTSVAAGSTCPKTAYGSNRITCFAEVDQTDIHERDEGHGHGHKHKKEIETSRTIHRYKWSFLWNYIVTDDCPKTNAHLGTLLPLLGDAPHLVHCRIEVGWGHDKESHKNQSWDFAGHGQIDGRTLPARMEWPLFAGYGRPDHYIKSREMGVKYDSAKSGTENTFEIHAGPDNHFSHSWGYSIHGLGGLGGHGRFSGHGEIDGNLDYGHSQGYDERGQHGGISGGLGGGYGGQGGHGRLEGHDGHLGFEGYQGYIQEQDGHNDKDNKGKKDKKKKHGHKDREEEHWVSKEHKRFGGHYNTKHLYSCWVFEKFHHADRQIISEKKKKGHHGHHGHHDEEFRQNITVPTFPFHHPPAWATCEPQIPTCHEDKGYHGDSFRRKQNDCHGDSCGRKQNDCHDDSCGRRQVTPVQNKQQDFHGGKQEESHHGNQENSYHRDQKDSHHDDHKDSHKQEGSHHQNQEVSYPGGYNISQGQHGQGYNQRDGGCSSQSCHDDDSDDGSNDDCEDDCSDEDSSDGSNDDCEDDCSDEDSSDGSDDNCEDDCD